MSNIRRPPRGPYPTIAMPAGRIVAGPDGRLIRIGAAPQAPTRHPIGWPHGGDALPPDPPIPGNPITTYHLQQGDDPSDDPGGSPGGTTTTHHSSSHGSSALASSKEEKEIAKTLATLLAFEQSQLRPRGRLGGAFTLTAVINPALPGGIGLYIPDIEVARLEGVKAGTRMTLYSKNGPFTGTSTANPGSPVGPEDFSTFGNGFQPRVLMKIRIGGGNNAGGDHIFQVVPAGVPVTLAGESIYVTAGVYLDEFALSPFFMDGPGTFSVAVAAFLSVQGDAVDQKSTQWAEPVTPLSNNGLIETDSGVPVYGPRHLKQAHGFASAANAGTTYLMFFDWNGSPTALPPTGTAPLFTIPIPPGLHFSWDCITSSRKFEWGLVWALSTAPDFFALDGASLARVDLELYSDLQKEP